MSEPLRETVGPTHGPGAAANEAGRARLKRIAPDFASDDAAEAWAAADFPPLPKGFTVADVKKASAERKE